MDPKHPYIDLDTRAFWKAAVGSRHFVDVEALWEPMRLEAADRVATAGSCFAQHIGINLARRGAHFMDVEPSPVSFPDEDEARRWGFGVFSARYGNIYTPRQLLQLFKEAHHTRTPSIRVWERDGRFFDALRPSIDPVGQATAEDVLALRQHHLAAVRRLFTDLNVFVFTLGLTEGWEAVQDGTMYPMAPGTVAGVYEPASYRFRNLRYDEIYQDMTEFWSLLRNVNPQARMLLTVSPVPLAATASGEHVLVASTHSKSVLRAVAGDLAGHVPDIFYFPAYEIITAPASRGMFFNPDLRGVNQLGVDTVMRHFFSGRLAHEFGEASINQEAELICDEELLDQS